jgi:hypothetical protein
MRSLMLQAEGAHVRKDGQAYTRPPWRGTCQFWQFLDKDFQLSRIVPVWDFRGSEGDEKDFNHRMSARRVLSHLLVCRVPSFLGQDYNTPKSSNRSLAQRWIQPGLSRYFRPSTRF